LEVRIEIQLYWDAMKSWRWVMIAMVRAVISYERYSWSWPLKWPLIRYNAARARVDKVRCLIEYVHSVINVQNYRKKTALHYAVTRDPAEAAANAAVPDVDYGSSPFNMSI
jgi:hypothetical protein